MDSDQGGAMTTGTEIPTTEFQLDLLNQRLLRWGKEVFLRRKTFDVLCYLVDRRRELVTQDELLDAAWGEGAGDAGGLRVCIRELRKAFRDDPKAPRFIETRRKRGYRWVGPIAAVGDPARHRQEWRLRMRRIGVDQEVVFVRRRPGGRVGRRGFQHH